MAKLTPKLSLYGEVLRVLEQAQADYVIVGGFAAQAYGSTRVTKDVDMIVRLDERQIQRWFAHFRSRATMPIPIRCAIPSSAVSCSTSLTVKPGTRWI